jgi:Bacteriocin-protection, YdeI or OmpD-Associated/Domain of unknown function (DUF1905)
MDPKPVSITATLIGEKGEYYFILPIDFQAVFGRHRPPVRVTIRGHTYRTTPARYGEQYFVVVNRANREAMGGLDHGDRVRITIELDTEPRVVTPPPELTATLAANAAAATVFTKLSFSHQKAYADWVAEAKRPETRVRRADESVKRLIAGRKEPNG